jgi:hypothetical protein
MRDLLAPVYSDICIISVGDSASDNPLAKIRGLVTIDGTVGGNAGELSAQVAVRLGLSYGKSTS